MESKWRDRLRNHAGNDPGITISLCDAFLQEVPALLSKVRLYLERNEHLGSELFQPVHTLKSCLNYVAEADHIELATRLEQSIKTESVKKEQFQGEFDRLDRIATDWVQRVQEFRNELIPKTRDEH